MFALVTRWSWSDQMALDHAFGAEFWLVLPPLLTCYLRPDSSSERSRTTGRHCEAFRKRSSVVLRRSWLLTASSAGCGAWSDRWTTPRASSCSRTMNGICRAFGKRTAVLKVSRRRAFSLRPPSPRRYWFHKDVGFEKMVQ